MEIDEHLTKVIAERRTLRIALQSLTNYVANMRVPQTLEDAALQVFQFAPVLRHAQHVLETIKE